MREPSARFSEVRALIFDLDGTLIDSKLDLALAVNAAMQELGRAPLPHETIFSYVGQGAPNLIARALGEGATDEECLRGLEFFIVQRERDQLLKEKIATLHNMMIADRIVSLGLLAAGLSHHIRNSLVAVKTFLDLAPAKLQEESLDLSGLRNPEFWKDYYTNVQSQIEKINNMLKDLWAVSETPSFAFKDEVALREVIGGVLLKVKDSLAAKSITVRNDIPETLSKLQVDKPKFDRLFELLLKDEIVTLPAGSEITISASPVLPTAGSPDEIEIRVSDNGPGLPKEALRLIFDPFVVRSDSPMEYGIHLMACYFIVHHHGGRIDARSDEGKGTTFTLRLPTHPSQAPNTQVDHDFLHKVLLSETLWEKLITSE